MPDELEGMDESPTLDVALDTQDDGISGDDETAGGTDAGRSQGGDDVERVRLSKENEELKKRLSGSTKTYQELQRIQQEKEALRQRLEAEDQRRAFWKAQGVDPDEIDRIVREKAGVHAPPIPPMQRNAPPPEQIVRVLGEHVQQSARAIQWEDLREEFIEKNSEYDSGHWRKWMDLVAGERIAQEKAENAGQIITKPRQMIKYVADVAAKMRAIEAKKAQEQARQTRTKVNQQGVVENASQKRRPSADADEDTPMSDDDYVSLFKGRTAKIKARR